MSSTPRAADDFEAIRERREQLKRDREAADLEKAKAEEAETAAQQKDDPAPCGFAIKAIKLRRLRLLRGRT